MVLLTFHEKDGTIKKIFEYFFKYNANKIKEAFT